MPITARMASTKVIVGSWTMCMDASLNLVKVVGAIVDLVSMSAVFCVVAIHLLTSSLWGHLLGFRCSTLPHDSSSVPC